MNKPKHARFRARTTRLKGVVLDSAQQAFCGSEDGCVRLLAPAGSGKTFSLLHRCKAIAERVGDARVRFLVFTFTRAARDELRDRLRIDPAFAQVHSLVNVTTLNAWGFRQVKNRMTNPKLLTSQADRFFCMSNVLQPVWRNHERVGALLEDSRRRPQAARELSDLIDFLKSMGFRHERMASDNGFEAFLEHVDYLRECRLDAHLVRFFRRLQDLEIIRGKPEDSLKEAFDHFMRFWVESCVHLGRSALLTLDDQKYWARILLEEQVARGVSVSGAARYPYVLVDEFQDINPLDLQLLRAVTAINEAELTIVGDDDQAIYEWRGATPEFILSPEKFLGRSYKTIVLTNNYRSPRNIVVLSQKLIAHNRRRVPKDVHPVLKRDAEIRVLQCRAIPDSVERTVQLVEELSEKNDCERIALIGRKRSQIIPYQIVFAGKGIPFYAAEDLHVLLSEAFEELKGILKIRAMHDLDVPFGGDPVQDLLKLCDKVKRYPLSKTDRGALLRELYSKRPTSLLEAWKALLQYTGPLKGSNEDGRMSRTFASAIAALMQAQTVAQCVEAVSEHFEGLQKDYGKSLDDIFYADPPFLYLAEFAERYGDDFTSFYRDVEKAVGTLARVAPDDELEEKADSTEDADWKRRLHLMTALRAKGKEFDAVIVLDANDGIWPSRFARTDEEREQERRLFYVAVTRARRYLYFVVNDSILRESQVPSPYLAEMGLIDRSTKQTE